MRTWTKTRMDKFDPGADFMIAKPFVLSGHGQCRGAKLDKALLTVRKMRMLYEQRKIKVAEPAHVEAPPPQPDDQPKSFRPFQRPQRQGKTVLHR